MDQRNSESAVESLLLRRISDLTKSISAGVRLKLQIAFGAVALMTVVAAAVGIWSFSALADSPKLYYVSICVNT